MIVKVLEGIKKRERHANDGYLQWATQTCLKKSREHILRANLGMQMSHSWNPQRFQHSLQPSSLQVLGNHPPKPPGIDQSTLPLILPGKRGNNANSTRRIWALLRIWVFSGSTHPRKAIVLSAVRALSLQTGYARHLEPLAYRGKPDMNPPRPLFLEYLIKQGNLQEKLVFKSKNTKAKNHLEPSINHDLGH